MKRSEVVGVLTFAALVYTVLVITRPESTLPNNEVPVPGAELRVEDHQKNQDSGEYVFVNSNKDFTENHDAFTYSHWEDVVTLPSVPSDYYTRDWCQLRPLVDTEEYYNFLNTPVDTCRAQALVTDYHVCFDHFSHPCIAYSFGIANYWGFDDLMDEYDCKVYSFDPTMGVEDHQRSPNIQFFNLGLSDFKGSKSMSWIGKRDMQCKVDRYNNIVEMLGHSNKTINFLKVDIEGSELDFFRDAFTNFPHLLKNVKQILLEIHNIEHIYFHTGNSRNTTLNDYWQILQLLNCHGFRLVNSAMTELEQYQIQVNGKTRGTSYITTWITWTYGDKE